MRLRLLTMMFLIAFLTGASLVAENWPHWRGPAHDGASGESGLPVSWGAKCLSNPGVAGREASALPVSAFAQRGGFPGGRGGFGRREGRPLARTRVIERARENYVDSVFGPDTARELLLGQLGHPVRACRQYAVVFAQR